MKIYVEKRKSRNNKLYTRAYYESTSPDGNKCFHNTITFDKWAIGAMLGGISEYHKMKEGDVYEIQLDNCYTVVSSAETSSAETSSVETSLAEISSAEELRTMICRLSKE